MLKMALVLLALVAAASAFTLVRSAIDQHAWPRKEAALLGAVTDFFDTLGIGSFAPTMAWFKFRRLVPDDLIPQTIGN